MRTTTGAVTAGSGSVGAGLLIRGVRRSERPGPAAFAGLDTASEPDPPGSREKKEAT